MPKFKFPEFRVADTPGEPNGGGPRAPGSAPRAFGGGGMARKLIGVLLILAMVYACYFWLVPPGRGRTEPGVGAPAQGRHPEPAYR
jgi:hypothetical protein